MSQQSEVLFQPTTRATGVPQWSRWPLLLVLMTTGVLAARLFLLVNRYAVNIFFWDQWDFNNATLFQKHSLWEMFRWQHGPHRQGVGAVVSWIIQPMFRWNSRAEAFLACAIFVIAALLALYLKKRLYGPLTYGDAAIPLIFLTPMEYESLFGSTNLSHGPFPILLLVVYCIGWTQPRAVLRYTWVLITNFLLIYTGFGFFVGIITPLLLILDYVRQKRAGLPDVRVSVSLAALFIALASFLSFFIGYKFDPAAGCFQPFSEPLVEYLHFAAVMFANFIGIKPVWWLSSLAGGLILLWAGIAMVAAFAGIVARKQQGGAQDIVGAALLLFTLLFCANAALGRLCLGLALALNSRYVPYLAPAFLGLYFSCLNHRSKRTRTFRTIGFLAIAISASVPVRIGDRSMMAQFHRVKNNWRDCYLQHHDIQQCDALTENKIYPWPDSTHLKEKLDYLEQNKLNLYATRD